MTTYIRDCLTYYANDVQNIVDDVKSELSIPGWMKDAKFDAATASRLGRTCKRYLYVPSVYFLTSNGFVMKYLTLLSGERRKKGLANIFKDVVAGITVAVMMIPQGLAYGVLANLPAVYGLYSAIVPSAIYCLFGTSSSVHVGPVAIICLLTGSLISKYSVQYGEDLNARLDIATECSFCVGLVLCVMSFLNMGQFIRLVPHSVMSSFTTAAAVLIGLSQLKSAWGFQHKIPKVGVDDDITANYQVMRWYVNNFDGRFDDDVHGNHLYRNNYAFYVRISRYMHLFYMMLWCIYYVMHRFVYWYTSH